MIASSYTEHVRVILGKKRNTLSNETPETKKLNLVCPYCGGELSVEMAHSGGVYSDYQVADGFECLEWTNCGAEWDKKGILTSEPRYLRFPESFQKPELSNEND